MAHRNAFAAAYVRASRTAHISSNLNYESSLIETGSYVGDGLTQTILTAFIPELVIIAPENEDNIMWRDNLCWHGRTQYFHSDDSEHAILSSINLKVNPWLDSKFRVYGNANKTGIKYHYVIIKSNDSTLTNTSWIGNALDRVVQFTTKKPDAIFIKRDSIRPGIWKFNGIETTLITTYRAGTNSSITSLDENGVTITDDVNVNENDNGGAGEGIAGIVLNKSKNCDVITYTGDGITNRVIQVAFTPTSAFIFDAVNDNTVNTQHHAFITDTMMQGNAKLFESVLTDNMPTFVANGINLSDKYNVNGRLYSIIAFKNNIENFKTNSFYRSNKTALITDGEQIELSDYPILSGACTMEWFGRPDFGHGNNTVGRYIPLILSGTELPGTLATTGGTYNGGIYISAPPMVDDPWWIGGVLRVIHTDYLCIERHELSINYYSLNTGIIIPLGEEIHIVVTHNGNGHWQIYINGKKVKDYNVDLNTPTYGYRTNGGAGIETTTRLLSGTVDNQNLGAWGRCYRHQVWQNIELTNDEAESLYKDVIETGTVYTGTPSTKSYDFRNNEIPAGVVISGKSELQIMSNGLNERLLYSSSKYNGYIAEISKQINGDTWITAAAGSTSGRVCFPLPAGKKISIRTKISYEGASRIILRYSETNRTALYAASDIDIYDISSTGILDRTDIITVPDMGAICWIIGIMPSGAKYIIHPEMNISIVE